MLATQRNDRAHKEATRIYQERLAWFKRIAKFLAWRSAGPGLAGEIADEAQGRIWQKLVKLLNRSPESEISFWALTRFAVLESVRARFRGLGERSELTPGTAAERMGGLTEEEADGAPSTCSRHWGPADEAAFRVDLEAALACMPGPAQRIVLLRGQGHSLPSIARRTGFTLDQVRYRLDGAKAHLSALQEV
jgi:DNA-directed RNA polymerase specialized sigma24 family protein